MPRPEVLYNGFVVLVDGSGIHSFTLYQGDDGHIYAYVNGEMADDVDSAEEFASSYGEGIMQTLKQYRSDDGYDSIFDVWPE